jgi:hypothetical protein
VGTIFHLTARVHCPFPVSIASLEEHLESVVIVRTSLEKAGVFPVNESNQL